MDPTALLQRLVRINSVNPSLTAGAPGEPPVVELLRNHLNGLPIEIEILEGTPGRPTLVATRKGTGGGRSLLFNAHTDTVGVEGMADPFSGHIEAGRLYGRGSYDMKGGLAAAVEAFAAIARGPALRGDLVLAAVADEEFASLGTEELLRHVRTDAAIVTEPTSLDLCLAHKGFTWIEITTHGRAAHGSRPDLGIDANLAVAPLLTRLAALAEDLQNRPAHPLLGRPSLHVATLRGGTAWSTYSAECTIQIERRMLPGETAASVLAEIAAIAAPHLPRLIFHREAFETSPQTQLVETVSAAVHATTGENPQVCGQTPWFDAALFAAAGIQTVILGHHGAGAHEAEEWADLNSLHILAQALETAARRWCE